MVYLDLLLDLLAFLKGERSLLGDLLLLSGEWTVEVLLSVSLDDCLSSDFSSKQSPVPMASLNEE